MNLLDRARSSTAASQFGSHRSRSSREHLGERRQRRSSSACVPRTSRSPTDEDGLAGRPSRSSRSSAPTPTSTPRRRTRHPARGRRRADAKPFVARVDGRKPPEKGETVYVYPKPGHVHVFDTETGARRRLTHRPTPDRSVGRSLAVRPARAQPRRDRGHLARRCHASRSPRPGPTRRCWTCPGRSRSRSGRPTTSPRCPAASPGTSCGSCACPGGSSRSRRSRPSWPEREYGMLRSLGRLDLPCVEPFGVVQRADRPRTASRWTRCLVTRHLQFSLPYRALYSPDAAAGHRRAAGRRPRRAARPAAPRPASSGATCRCPTPCSAATPGAFAAYLVDAETGELHDRALRRPARARPGHRPGQHRRRADGPARPAACSRRTPTRWRSPSGSSTRYRVAVGAS